MDSKSDKMTFKVANDNPKILKVTTLQLIGAFFKLSNKASGFSEKKLVPQNFSSKKPCSMPTW